MTVSDVSEFVRKDVISLAEPALGAEEADALRQVIEGGWLTMGPRVAEFEAAFAELHGRNAAIAVSSCTAALHLSLAVSGVGPGDEVLLPSLTFVATANAVRYVGASPVFVDVESLEQPWMSLADAVRKLTLRTRAVIVVHYAGYLADMSSWRRFADEHGLVLIEDAAHAPECAGSDGMADISAFSFFTNKNMTTAEGGMLLARDEAVLDRTRRMRSHGMTSMTLDRDRGHAFSYDVVDLGYNYRMDEIRAALGLVQLRRLAGMNEKRRQLSREYRRLMVKHCPEVVIPFGEGCVTDAHLLPIVLPPRVERPKLMRYLRDRQIQSSIHYPPVHRFSWYRRNFPGISLPQTEAFSGRELTLPLHPFLTSPQVAYVVETLREAMA